MFIPNLTYYAFSHITSNYNWKIKFNVGDLHAVGYEEGLRDLVTTLIAIAYRWSGLLTILKGPNEWSLNSLKYLTYEDTGD